MPILSNSPSARMTLTYITSGALLITWSVIWYFWLTKYPPARDSTLYFCYGLLATGAILLTIGLSLGWIGRAARPAELPPRQVTADTVEAEKNLVAPIPVVVTNPAPTVMPNGPVAVPVATPAPVANVSQPGTPVTTT